MANIVDVIAAIERLEKWVYDFGALNGPFADDLRIVLAIARSSLNLLVPVHPKDEPTPPNLFDEGGKQ